MENEIAPWFPLADIPQCPCAIVVAGGPEHVEAKAVYSFFEGDRDLLIGFDAEVFGCFSEAAAPPVNVPEAYPRLRDKRWAGYLWPLMEVGQSTWLAGHRERLWMPERTYRHYRIVSEDGTFDAISCQAPSARWIPTETGSR